MDLFPSRPSLPSLLLVVLLSSLLVFLKANEKHILLSVVLIIFIVYSTHCSMEYFRIKCI